jgi:cell division protease FtsH
VRDLFAKAKEAAPSIVFIDEIDAVGRSRQGNAHITGANDEREQTLDQILTEMDGFDSTQAVVVVGATNRPEILDPALLRPGRFDRRVAVQPPDRTGRQMADFTDSLEKILLGAPRGIILGPEDRERTAYHESGHALVGMLTPEADPVRKVSIIPRGQALGVTLSTPDADRVSYSREELEAKIEVSLGGRVAEEVVYGKITTGAESDLQQLSQIARQMVGRWGMSDRLGPITLLAAGGQGPLFPGAGDTSPQTQWLIDEEVRRIVDDAHAEVTRLLTEHREQLDRLAHALLEAETLDAPDAYAAAGVPMRTAELESTASVS